MDLTCEKTRIFGAHLLPNILIIWYLSIYWLIMKAILVLYKLSNKVLMNALHYHMEATNISYYCLSLWYRNEFENSKPFKTKPLMEIISNLSDFRSRLDKHLQNVLEIFHISLMINFLSVFFTISIQTFELYTYCDTPDMDDINALLWMLMQLMFSTWRAIFVLLVHNSITNEKCHTIYILNAIPAVNVDMEKNIARFFQQLITQQYTENVYDLFNLDLGFLTELASALTTYVIFLIQINLDSVSLTKGKINDTFQ
ncbi:hypothetical protein GQX74_005562 [Glossina fuscipes]|nr:hypothetical protein GQX74_005562 [Glossina fuscipes]